MRSNLDQFGYFQLLPPTGPPPLQNLRTFPTNTSNFRDSCVPNFAQSSRHLPCQAAQQSHCHHKKQRCSAGDSHIACVNISRIHALFQCVKTESNLENINECPLPISLTFPHESIHMLKHFDFDLNRSSNCTLFTFKLRTHGWMDGFQSRYVDSWFADKWLQ